ncbi:MAG: SH3 domain-containing protein [Alphaproteobacteria bacterium]|nr:SH3 domain-containing protein [Alphaproteobacteria bacterium]MCW5741326.1 SH3 domain-containing protein [Alphaproteobacteria bacterium]
MRADFLFPLLRFARICLAGLAATALVLPDLPASASASAQEMVSVSREKVNMRAGPGTNHQATWMLSKGYPLVVIGREGDWLKVQDFEKDVGWILRSLTGGVAYHIVTARVANLRATPSESSRVLGQAVYGETVRTLEKRDSWVQVQRENKMKGWIARRLLWGW